MCVYVLLRCFTMRSVTVCLRLGFFAVFEPLHQQQKYVGYNISQTSDMNLNFIVQEENGVISNCRWRKLF